jgi:hypothetical protein
MSKQTEEQHTELNDILNRVERAFMEAKTFSNQSGCRMASEERRFIASFCFGKAVTSCFLSMDSGSLAKEVSKGLSDKAEALHNDVCNTCVNAFCFTDAESATCPCNCNGADDLDVLPSLLESLKVSCLSDSLLPCADLLIAIATIEEDQQAIETAKRIKHSLTC